LVIVGSVGVSTDGLGSQTRIPSFHSGKFHLHDFDLSRLPNTGWRSIALHAHGFYSLKFCAILLQGYLGECYLLSTCQKNYRIPCRLPQIQKRTLRRNYERLQTNNWTRSKTKYDFMFSCTSKRQVLKVRTPFVGKKGIRPFHSYYSTAREMIISIPRNAHGYTAFRKLTFRKTLKKGQKL